MKTVHVPQPIRGIGQLDGSVRLAATRYNTATYELDTVHSLVHPNILVDVPVVRPLGHHRKLTISNIYSE
jgi:hypothetical protein